MIEYIDKNKTNKIISLDKEYFFVLLDYFDPIFKGDKLESTNNVFLINFLGAIIWRVHSNLYISGGFVDIFYKENILKGIGWDTGLYSINKTTGFATPEKLLK